MNKAVFLDRDGTINRDYGYVYQKDKLEFMPGVLQALKRIKKAGFLLLIVTNQSGIGRGYFSKEQYREFEAILLEQMAQQGVIIDKVYVCPHAPGEGCSCRKPLLGMFYQAAEEFDIDWENSYAIGDKERDLSICEKEKIKGILYSDSKALGENKVCLESWEEIADYVLAKAGDSAWKNISVSKEI